MDGDPPRRLAWAAGPSHISWQQATMLGVPIDRYWVFIDTGNCRVVTLWAPDELEAMAESLHKLATGGLSIRDAGDLASIPEITEVDQPR